MVKVSPTLALPIAKKMREEEEAEKIRTAKEACEAKGGTWDAVNQACRLPKPEVTPVTPETPEVFRDVKTGNITGFTQKGQDFLGLSPAEIAQVRQTQLEKTQLPLGTAEFGTAQAAATQQFQGQQLVGQVGQVQPSTGITPTELDVGEAAVQGAVGSIPSALRTGATIGGAALIGGKIGAAVGTAAAPATAGISIPVGAAIGAAVGLVAGVVGGMTSNMKGQRTDNTNAQQRVLDEGKQTLKDWSTMAKADPANREFYLSQFNLQLQLIQNAHVQMLTDTNADVLKFESAVPNLAEFNSFYSVGGERDALVNDMVISLQTPVSVDYQMLELTNRRLGIGRSIGQ